MENHGGGRASHPQPPLRSTPGPNSGPKILHGLGPHLST